MMLTGVGVLSTLAARAEGCTGSTSPMQQVELYFGSSVKGRPFVTERTWSKFLDSEVTPRFPDGLTVFDAHGQWRSGDGRIYREATRGSSSSIRPTPRAKGRSRPCATPIRNNSIRKMRPCGSTRRSAPHSDGHGVRNLDAGPPPSAGLVVAISSDNLRDGTHNAQPTSLSGRPPSGRPTDE